MKTEARSRLRQTAIVALVGAVLLSLAPWGASQVDPLLPGPPRNLVASAGPGVGEITLTWETPENGGLVGVSSYRVYAGDASGGEAFLADVGNVLTFTETGLASGTTRFYQVSAVNLVGEGPRSNEANATTFDVPDPPENLVALPGANVGEVALSWDAPADGGSSVTAYRLYRAAGASESSFLAEVSAEPRTFTDTGLTPLTQYHYRVSAVNAVGEGEQSTAACSLPFPWVVLEPLGTCPLPE